MTELDIQSAVVLLHGPDPIPALEKVIEQTNFHALEPIKRAVSYILQFGSSDTKVLASQAAQILGLSA